MKIGSLKMCGGCKLVGYFGKEEQKKDWPSHKEMCKEDCGFLRCQQVGRGLLSCDGSLPQQKVFILPLR